MGAMRNVTISGIEAVRCSRTGCAVAGLPGHPIENVTIENVRLSFAGGGAAGDAGQEVPENPDKYPEFHMFGKVLPAYGFYCRHLKDLKLRDIETRYEQKDGRPALIAEDVEGLELAGGSLAVEPDSGASVRLRHVKSAFLHGCRAASSSHAYVHATGSSDVYLTGNDLRRASKEIESA
jgi:hypothetical protein